jgi:hypothetical protein
MGETSPPVLSSRSSPPPKPLSVLLFDPPSASPHASPAKGAPLLEFVATDLPLEPPTPVIGAPLLELVGAYMSVKRTHLTSAPAATIGADPKPPLQVNCCFLAIFSFFIVQCS